MDSIQLFRERKRLTQERVAELLGTTQSVVSKVERGEVDLQPNVAKNLAVVLNVPERRLMAAHKRMREINEAVTQAPVVARNVTGDEVLKWASRLAQVEVDSAVPPALRKRAGKAREHFDVKPVLAAMKSTDPDIDATGFRVAKDGDGNWYLVDPSTDPPTISPVQFGDLVQQQGQPAGSKAVKGSGSYRDGFGHKRKG